MIDYEKYKRRPLSSMSRVSENITEYQVSAKVKIRTQLDMIPIEFDLNYQDAKQRLRELLDEGLQEIQLNQNFECEIKQANLEVKYNFNPFSFLIHL